MGHLTILRDNREQKPWGFDDFSATTEDVTLETGDYTVAELCDYDGEIDTYYPNYAIERKAGEDFVQSITNNRERFLKEVKRASDWDCPMQVLIEEPKTVFKRNLKFMKYKDVTPSQIFGTVNNWERYYNIEFRFVGSREKCQRIAFDSLLSKLRVKLISGN